MGKRKTPDKFKTVPNLSPKTKNQGLLIDAINKKELIVTSGSAGTGKTFVSAYMAGLLYKSDKVNKIIITRPNAPTGRTLGSFPGTVGEKMEPWVAPVICVLEDLLGKDAVVCMLKNQTIEVVPFEIIRGRSWNDCFVILDEAQNTSPSEMKAFLTRLGEGSTTVINGDTSQTDVGKNNGLSMLLELMRRTKNFKGQAEHIKFGHEDIVRSGLCKSIVMALEDNPNL